MGWGKGDALLFALHRRVGRWGGGRATPRPAHALSVCLPASPAALLCRRAFLGPRVAAPDEAEVEALLVPPPLGTSPAASALALTAGGASGVGTGVSPPSARPPAPGRP